jgi:hypothetical protein
MNINVQVPNFKAYIFGLDITLDVLSVSSNWGANTRQPSTCTITLICEHNKYIVTTQDLLKHGFTFASDMNKLVTPSGDLFTDANRQYDITTKYATKDRIIEIKKNAIIDFTKVKSKMTFRVNSSKPVRDIASKYTFFANKSVFHAQDPVRVFVNNPSIEGADLWYHFFCGFISDVSISHDANGKTTLTILAESPEKILRYSRFTSNPGVTDIASQAVVDLIAEYSTDESIRTCFNNVFHGKSLTDTLRGIFYGIGSNTYDTAKFNDKDYASEWLYDFSSLDAQPQRKLKFGIGHINPVKEFVRAYGSIDAASKNKVESIILEDWKLELNQRVSANDVNVDGYTYVDANTPDLELVKILGEHPVRYPPGNGGLFILMPSAILGADVIQKDLVSTFNLNTEWSTRGEILYAALERLEFVFYTTPRGDYVVEFPLYDFKPSDFGRLSSQDYTIDLDRTTDVSIMESDSKIYTHIITTFGPFRDMDGLQEQNKEIFRSIGNSYTEFAWSLIPLYGLRSLPVTTKGYLTTMDAANVYAKIVMNRMNLDATTCEVRTTWLHNMWPNRPVYVEHSNMIGTVKSINRNITVGQSGRINCDVALFAIRGWDGTTQKDENGNLVMVYQHVGGKDSHALDYHAMFGGNKLDDNNRWSNEMFGKPNDTVAPTQTTHATKVKTKTKPAVKPKPIVRK